VKWLRSPASGNVPGVRQLFRLREKCVMKQRDIPSGPPGRLPNRGLRRTRHRQILPRRVSECAGIDDAAANRPCNSAAWSVRRRTDGDCASQSDCCQSRQRVRSKAFSCGGGRSCGEPFPGHAAWRRPPRPFWPPSDLPAPAPAAPHSHRCSRRCGLRA